MAVKNHSNTAIATTLASSIDSAATSLSVVDSSGYPNVPFTIELEADTANSEIILVGAKTGTTFSSLTRGYGGTTAKDHSTGAPVRAVFEATTANEIYTHYHGTNDSYVNVVHTNAENGADVTVNTVSPTWQDILSSTVTIPADWVTYRLTIMGMVVVKTIVQDADINLNLQIVWEGTSLVVAAVSGQVDANVSSGGGLMKVAHSLVASGVRSEVGANKSFKIQGNVASTLSVVVDNSKMALMAQRIT